MLQNSVCRKVFAAVFLLALFAQNAFAQNDYEIEREINQTLLTTDVGELAEKAANAPAESSDSDEDSFYDGLNWSPTDVHRKLFKAYLLNKDWRSAEKVLFNRIESFSFSSDDLSDSIVQIVLLAAAQNQVDDAVRLWKIRANFDRRKLYGLPTLAQTAAKERLRRFYLEMKRRDQHTTAPDAALALLQ